MTNQTDELTALVATLSRVRDEDLLGATGSPDARRLMASILEAPLESRHGSGHRAIIVAVAVFVAALLSIPALGVGSRIESLFAGWRDPEPPVPTASDVLIATGGAGVHWKIVATPSDQGLCLGLFYRAGGDSLGSAGCGYSDIRGALPSDLRGDPDSKCIATPTSPLVPCGSLPLHWIDVGSGDGGSVGLDRAFVFEPLAHDVAGVELLLTDGQRLETHVVEAPGGLPLDFYWASWPCPVQPVTEGPYGHLGLRECQETGGPVVKMAVARDTEGHVLERRVPAWNGNPLGDPDGPPPPAPG
jgi:hypothetical protein